MTEPDEQNVGIVLTVIARDRPGLVERLSDVVERHSGNWIDSSLARLGGEFAGIVQIVLPGPALAAFEAALAALSKDGIDCLVRRDPSYAGVILTGGPHARLELTGVDHPGIVHEVSSALARHGVSIDALETRVFQGSMSGEAMFAAAADIVLPPHLSSDELRLLLEDIAQDIMVDIDLAEVEAPRGSEAQ